MAEVTVTAKENGPYMVEGTVKIVNSEGKELKLHKDPGYHLRHGSKLFLCRCGGSSNKPFCDGTHKKNGFEG